MKIISILLFINLSIFATSMCAYKKSGTYQITECCEEKDNEHISNEQCCDYIVQDTNGADAGTCTCCCADLYSLNKITYECMECRIPSCKNCDTTTSCAECKDGMHLRSGYVSKKSTSGGGYFDISLIGGGAGGSGSSEKEWIAG